MIRLTLEIIPHGDESKKFIAGSMQIANDCTGKNEIGNYDFSIFGPVKEGDSSFPNELWEKGRLNCFDRRRGYWSCVKECLATINTDYEI